MEEFVRLHQNGLTIIEISKKTGISYSTLYRKLKSINLLDKKFLSQYNPSLAEQWHKTKNGNLTPDDVTCDSHKIAWWVCKICKSEWQSSITNRNRGRGCLFCAGHKVNDTNSLCKRNPSLAKEFHETKNGNLTSNDVTCGSGKTIWWFREICGHEWQAAIVDRNNGNGCPFCAGRKVDDTNSLAKLNPSLAKEFHKTKNGNLTPNDVTSNSNKNVWWFREICGHEWKTSIGNRSNGGRGCPFCAGKKVDNANSLTKCNPSLAGEWHKTKNGNLTSNDITCNSHKIVWWTCEICKYEWEARISSRNSGNGCSMCNGGICGLQRAKFRSVKEKLFGRTSPESVIAHLNNELERQKKRSWIDLDKLSPNQQS